jgi:hypothetical protein
LPERDDRARDDEGSRDRLIAAWGPWDNAVVSPADRPRFACVEVKRVTRGPERQIRVCLGVYRIPGERFGNLVWILEGSPEKLVNRAAAAYAYIYV